MTPSLAAALFATCGCLSGLQHQLTQPGIPRCRLPQLLQLQEGLNVPSALSIHLLPVKRIIELGNIVA